MKPDAADQSTILVVDDQEINRHIIQTIFRDRYRILVAANGEQALRLSADEQPDLVLLDVLMPDMDGLEVCRRLKESDKTRDIPVIFVTSQNDPEEETRALEAGAVDFISKPINASVGRGPGPHAPDSEAAVGLLAVAGLCGRLTGVFNRRRLEEYLEYEWHRCARSQSSLAVFMIDVDNFKQFNDTYGHLAGDACLKEVAQILKSNLKRAQDLVARYGGEGICLSGPDTQLPAAQKLADQIVQAVAQAERPVKEETRLPPVTISLGFAVMVPDEKIRPKHFLAAADALLYEAKRTGKNRAVGDLVNNCLTGTRKIGTGKGNPADLLAPRPRSLTRPLEA